MFSGIVISQGTVEEISTSGDNGRLAVDSPEFIAELSKIDRKIALGESILVSGVCLTVIKFSATEIVFDLASETLRKTKFGKTKVGDRLNLEPSLRLNDILSGHLVTGHVDGVGSLVERAFEGETLVLSVSYPPALARYLVSKGSISIDGVSLTVGDVTSENFNVYIVPHTAKVTTLGDLSVGDSVNLEIDLIARYVERQITVRPISSAGV
jgi:riboflavin synthase